MFGMTDSEINLMIAARKEIAEKDDKISTLTAQLTAKDAQIAKLREVLERMIKWLNRLADNSKKQAENCRFESLKTALIADEKNFRATAKGLRQALAEEGK